MQRALFLIGNRILRLTEMIGRPCFNLYKNNLPPVVGDDIHLGFFEMIVSF